MKEFNVVHLIEDLKLNPDKQNWNENKIKEWQKALYINIHYGKKHNKTKQLYTNCTKSKWNL